MKCLMCPRKCGSDRSDEKGFCGSNENFKLARAALHMWEEPFLVGRGGSGTIFFSNCNLKCVYCQNFKISADGFGKEVTSDKLIEIIFQLVELGAENINFVTPSHFVTQLADVLGKVKSKLPLPVVYNSGGYDDVESLKKLDGLVDIYLPDMKYVDSNISKKYSHAEDYFEKAKLAIAEMKRQQPSDILVDGLMKKGVAVRHLILPNLTDQSKKALSYLAESYGADVYISIMSQYQPFYQASNFPELNRKITSREYNRVLDFAIELGLSNALCQELTSANEKFVPDFNLEGI